MRGVEPLSGTSGLDGRVLRVATWNVDHWKRTVAQRDAAWSKLRELGVDVALLQETVPPTSVPRDHLAYRPIGNARAWGSAVVSLMADVRVQELDAVRTRYGSRLFSMLGHLPGAVMVARADVPEFGAVTFVSVYGAIETYSQTTMFRIVADLIPLFDSPEGEHVVLGGDFNITTAAGSGAPELGRYAAILHAVESLGLIDLAKVVADRPDPPAGCPCGRRPCTHLATFRGAQLDYLFATPALAKRCLRLWVPADTAQLSDHAPIVVDVDASTRLDQTKWDPRSFATLVAERHGAAAGRVVDDLVAWARRKQDDLQRSGHAGARLDRLPTSEGSEPQVWFMLDLAGRRGVQYTFSLRADGMVVLQFQWMTGPFATEACRHALWERLSAIPGVDLAPRLNGRPTFPIAALADEERLRAFLAALDHVVDETARALGTPA